MPDALPYRGRLAAVPFMSSCAPTSPLVKQAILEARWSPDRDTVALGCEDSSVYLYSTGENFELVATAVKHKDPVRALPKTQT